MTAFSRSLALAILLGLGAAACDRTYLTPSHGRAYRQAFTVQMVNPGRQTEASAVHGLDSQEAAIISQSYRRNLGSRDQAPAPGAGSPLMYTPGSNGRDNSLPPPSVPPDR
jgi:hypothetical protein